MSLIEEALRRSRDPLAPTPTGPTTSIPVTSVPQGTAAAPISTPPKIAKPHPQAHSWSTTPVTGSPQRLIASRTLPIAVGLSVSALVIVLVLTGTFWMGRTVGHTRIDTPPLTEKSAETTTRHPAPDNPFIVTGIVRGLGEPYAMINGQILAIGDQIGDATLTGIAQGQVTMQDARGKNTVVVVAR